MTVLVTGGAGYIGSHMVLKLLDKGEQVSVVDDLSTGHAWAVDKRATLIEGDVGDAGLVSSIIERHGIDAIMHFAGSIVVPESVADPLGYYFNNTVKAHSLIRCAVRGGVPNFIFSSTAAVYGTNPEGTSSETDLLAPESPYGMSKLMTETMLQDAARAHGFDYGILRYFNVAGADPKGRSGQTSKVSTHLIKIASEVVTGQREGMTIFGNDYDTPDGTCIRDYIHVWDLVEAHWLALERLRKGGGSIVANCGYGHGHSVSEVVDTVARCANWPLKAVVGARRPGDPPRIVADPTRAKEQLGWKPAHDDLEEIVQHALAWERKLASCHAD